MRRSGNIHPHNRDGIWYLVRRVPREFEHLDSRRPVRISTKISVADDPRKVRAQRAVEELNRELEAYWLGLRDGVPHDSQQRFDGAVRRARQLDLPYQTASEIAGGPTEDILRRIEMLLSRGAIDNADEVAAVLGGEERPQIRLSGLLGEVEKISATQLQKMSPNQLRRWRNGKRRAIEDLRSLIGDKALSEMTRVDGLTYRSWWQERISNESLDIETANKAFAHISGMLSLVDNTHQIGLQPVFSKLYIKGAEKRQRKSFDTKFIRDRILAPGELGGLNDEARAIVMICADSGMRPVEVCNLLPEHIHLDAKVPHVQIRATGRVLKVAHTARDMPLVGNALVAMREFRNGFSRYLDKSDGLSAVVNKYFRDHDLLPTKSHSLYSFRHSFEDRLTAVEAPEKLIAALMGHQYYRPKYGAGPSLEQKQKWMRKIALS